MSEKQTKRDPKARPAKDNLIAFPNDPAKRSRRRKKIPESQAPSHEECLAAIREVALAQLPSNEERFAAMHAAVMDAVSKMEFRTFERKLLTPEELSEYINVPVETLAGWRRSDRKGPAHYELGDGHVRYSTDDVEKWLEIQAFMTKKGVKEP